MEDKHTSSEKLANNEAVPSWRQSAFRRALKLGGVGTRGASSPHRRCGDECTTLSIRQRSRLAFTSFLLLPLETGLKAIAVAGDVQDVYVVCEAIEQSPGQAIIVGEDLRPLRKGQIRGHD